MDRIQALNGEHIILEGDKFEIRDIHPVKKGERFKFKPETSKHPISDIRNPNLGLVTAQC